MKSLFRFLLVALLVVGFAYSANAASDYASQNVQILGVSGGASGITPPTVIMKVRYGFANKNATGTGDNISSGDVLTWDVNSADGITISRCQIDLSAPANTPVSQYAGVAVTDILTADGTTARGTERNWGYMAIHGYCLAKADTSKATTGFPLVMNGLTLVASFATQDQTGNMVMSQDIGTLLFDAGAASGNDILAPVWLR